MRDFALTLFAWGVWDGFCSLRAVGSDAEKGNCV